MDPATGMILKGGIGSIKLLARLANKPTLDFERERDEIFREWVAQLHAAIVAVLPDLDCRIADLESKLEALGDDRQLARIFDNVRYEAAREAVTERRAMLAYAAAGLLDPGLSVEEKARVERTLRELDSGEVRALYGLSLVVGRTDPEDPNRPAYNEQELVARVERRIPEGEILSAAGCIRLEAKSGAGGGWNECTITRVGRGVLRVLRVYVRDRGANFAVPGREHREGDRTEEEAHAVLADLPGLREFLRTVRRHPHFMSVPFYQPRAADSERGRLTLRFKTPARDELDRLREAIGHRELEMAIKDVPYQRSATEIEQQLEVDLTGPHDIMRWAADAADARWYVA